jgi:Ser/Thr protein kinase RdoA (MazF antagonist)
MRLNLVYGSQRDDSMTKLGRSGPERPELRTSTSSRGLMIDIDVSTVLCCYGLDRRAVTKIESLANAGGWSGSRLWRATTVDGRALCLRRWPAEHPTPVGLKLIHAVLELVAPAMPIIAFPMRTITGSTWVEVAGHRWELTNWLPGRADFHCDSNRKKLRAAMQALAQFHLLAAQYQQYRGWAPAIQDREFRLRILKFREFATIEQSLARRLNNEIDGRATRLLTLTRTTIEQPDLAKTLSIAPELWLQPAIRDIHHDHVLFTGDEVTGIIDFGAMRMDTPLTDVARLIGCLVGDDREAREFAVSAYSELRPLSTVDRWLVELLDESGLVLGALNWLTWLYVERRDMGPMEPIVRRLDQILERLERRAKSHFP